MDAGEPEAAQRPGDHIQRRQELAELIRETGGGADSARTSVAGFGRSASSKATWAARKAATLNETLHMEPQPVTMKSISNVKPFACETLDSSGQRQLQNAHKRLLMTASKQPSGVEVGKVFDLNMKPLTQDIVGSAEGHSVKLPNFNVPYAVIHTHPACGIFSHGDLSSFTKIVFILLALLLGEIVLFAGVALLSFVCEVIEEYRLIPKPHSKE